MKEAGDREPEELVAIALSALTSSGAALGTDHRDVITDRALMLHAARDPELRQPYLGFVDACNQQVAALIGDALAHARIELTVPLEVAAQLLVATHNHLQTLGLFDETRADPALIGTLLTAITRPVEEAGSPPARLR